MFNEGQFSSVLKAFNRNAIMMGSPLVVKVMRILRSNNNFASPIQMTSSKFRQTLRIIDMFDYISNMNNIKFFTDESI